MTGVGVGVGVGVGCSSTCERRRHAPDQVGGASVASPLAQADAYRVVWLQSTLNYMLLL